MGFQVVGYIRVSSIDQNPDRQLADIELDRKFIDHWSGAIKDRPQLNKCMEYVREGDTLIVHSIDRLARNLIDLQSIIKTLLSKGVIVKFVKENLAFTSTQDPMATLTLQIMGAFAEFERTMIRTRQREGIDAAKKSGKHLGRPPKTSKKMIESAKQFKEQGVSIRQISFRLEVSRATVYKMLAT
jgi:DNA invertase Pin-like site-specific DNA recombinase